MDANDVEPAAGRADPDAPGRAAAADDATPLDALAGYLEHEPDPMIVLDPDYRIVAANAAYRARFARPGAPLEGERCYRVSHGYDRPCDQAGEHCPMARARETLRPDRVLHVHHTPRGREHVDVTLRPIVAAGALRGFVERLAEVPVASADASGSGLVGRSAAFNRALGALRRVAPSELPVLLLGESGTGKELFARALHDASPRAAGPFVVLDCSGLTESLFESELFGHERGAFTGAHQRKAGLVETAHGGTLFLDELGDVPLAMQVKLLRLIETATYRRVGGVEPRRADFRLVAATHKDLRRMVAEGTFRADLYYRVSAFPIELPPLRERLEDLPELVASMLRRASGAERWTVEPGFLALLARYAFPGNIRELKNLVDRARLFSDDRVLRAEHLPSYLAEPSLSACAAVGPLGEAADAGRTAGAAGMGSTGSTAPVAAPRDALAAAVDRPGRVTRRRMAEAMGISERTLYRRLRAARR